MELLAEDAAQHGILHPAAAFLHTVALSVELDDLLTVLATYKEPGTQLKRLKSCTKGVWTGGAMASGLQGIWKNRERGRSLGVAKRQRDREAWPPVPPHLHTPLPCTDHSSQIEKKEFDMVTFGFLPFLPEIQLDNVMEFRNAQTLPSHADLRGAVLAIESLQKRYQLDASQFVDGKLARDGEDLIKNDDDGDPQPQLSAMDSYSIASALFDEELYESSYDWFNLVVERCTDPAAPIDQEPCPNEVIATALAKGSFVLYLSGNTTAAVMQSAEAITFDQNCTEAVQYLKVYFAAPNIHQIELEASEDSNKTAALR